MWTVKKLNYIFDESMQALVWNGHLEWLTDLETCHISLEQSLSLVEYRILLEKLNL